MMKTILLTGASGFLGHHFIKALTKAGYTVIGVDKRPIPAGQYAPHRFIQTDVKDLQFRDLMGVDGVIHLAWRTNIPDCKRHPEESTANNIGMTVHLLEICKEAGIKKFIFPSTASQYGNNPTPWTEDMISDPIEPYSWQKLSCEYLCKMYDVPCSIVRYFQVYGEHQREDTALAAFLRLSKNGEPITLTETMAQSKFKSGQRDFVYAGDSAKATIHVMEHGEDKEIYNVASGQVKTMEDIADAVGGEVKWIPKRDYEVERHEADISKLLALGWLPEVDVIKWIKQYVKNL